MAHDVASPSGILFAWWWFLKVLKVPVKALVVPERWCQLGTNVIVPQSYCLCSRPKGRLDFGVLKRQRS